MSGTEIRLHVTFLLFLVWMAFAHYLAGGWAAAIDGVLFICVLFSCVVFHEFGHILAARRFGVRTPEVVLFPIGGVARLERIPEKPAEELVVALAGPAVNVVIAAGLFIVLGGIAPLSGLDVTNPGADLLTRLMWANVILVGFNLIPAFPMDGGRVLRAFLAARVGYAQGTRIAANIGQALAFAFGLFGLLGAAPLLIFIALFVYLAASAEAHAAQMRQISRGMAAADAMITKFESLTPDSTVDDAVECLIRTTQHEFPVIDDAGKLQGLITRDELIKARKQRGPRARVAEVMREDIPTIEQHGPLEPPLRIMQEQQLPAVGITDHLGRLVGLPTPENVGEMMLVQAANSGGHRGRTHRLLWTP